MHVKVYDSFNWLRREGEEEIEVQPVEKKAFQTHLGAKLPNY